MAPQPPFVKNSESVSAEQVGIEVGRRVTAVKALKSPHGGVAGLLQDRDELLGARAARLACSWRTTLEPSYGKATRVCGSRGQEFRFVDLLDAERLRLLELDPGSAPTTNAVVFLDRLSTRGLPRLDQVGGLLAREGGKRAGDHERLVGERPRAVAVLVSLSVSPDSPALEQLLVTGVLEKPDTASPMAGPIHSTSPTFLHRRTRPGPPWSRNGAPGAWRLLTHVANARAKSRAESGCSFEAAILSTSCWADFSANPSRVSSCGGVTLYRSATVAINFASSSARTRS